METLWHDLRYGLRMLGRNPGFTAVAVLTLAVGIAANTATFSLVNAFFLRPLPFHEPERLVHIWQTDRQSGHDELRMSAPNFADLQEQQGVFTDVGGYFYQSVDMATDEEPVRVLVGRLTANMIDILGARPALGRGFLPGEDEAGNEKVVLLSHGLWHERYAADPDILSRTVMLNGEVYDVVGVMPPDFVFPLSATKMWTPLPLDPYEARREANGPLMVVARLEDRTSMAEAQAQVDTVMARLEQEHPRENHERGARVIPLRKSLLFFYDMLQLTFGMIFLAVGFVLLIVCANVGNLLLARATGRSREIAVRTALGGSRGRLIRQLLAESAALALIGGALGAAAAWGLVQLVGPNIPEDLYRVGEIVVDGRALVFTLSMALGASLLFGLAPALQTTKPNLTVTLKEGDRGGHGGLKHRRLRNALVVFEVAMAMVLLASSTLMVRSFHRMQTVEAGFDADNVLTMETILSPTRYASDQETNAFYEQVLERVRTLPSVRSAAEVYPLPLNFESMSQSFTIEGREPAQPGETLGANLFWVTTDYFRTMEIPIVRGRDFSTQDDDRAVPVVVISQQAADRFWPDEDPLGARVRLDPGTEDERLATIVGVVGNSKHFLMNEDTAALLYLPQLQDTTRRRFLVVKTAGDPLAMVDSVRDAVWAVDPILPITTIRTMDQVVGESLGPWAGGTAVIGMLGLGALLLAAMGIYGVISYSVSQRTHEVGVRMALGAQGGHILKLVMRQSLRLALLGVGIGLVAAVALSRLIQSLLFGVGPLDPITFVGTPLLLLAIASAASFFPALRATRVDPMTTLRWE
jgi:putative ABC transport system permease protein